MIIVGREQFILLTQNRVVNCQSLFYAYTLKQNQYLEIKFMGFLWFVLIGLIAGLLAGVLIKCNGCGIIGDITAGVVGALIGGFLFHFIGVYIGGGVFGALLIAAIGAVVFIFILRFINRENI
jgi:uncharacterized membrane protein YeaQ/YmgE (transglycosylase-associated protein family)